MSMSSAILLTGIPEIACSGYVSRNSKAELPVEYPHLMLLQSSDDLIST